MLLRRYGYIFVRKNADLRAAAVSFCGITKPLPALLSVSPHIFSEREVSEICGYWIYIIVYAGESFADP